jgi:thiol:disulfide interchange protein
MGLMIAFSIGLGTLLLVIAVFAGAVQILPRSGKWMNAVKVLSGLLLLGFAGTLIYKAGALGGA